MPGMWATCNNLNIDLSSWAACACTGAVLPSNSIKTHEFSFKLTQTIII